jgi:hypothetical protein
VNMADMYWDQPTDASQEQASVPEPEEPPDNAEEPSPPKPLSAPPEREPDEHLHDALRRVVLDDVAGYEQALRDAGFSEAEARRLVFERMRPREEGLTRRGG